MDARHHGPPLCWNGLHSNVSDAEFLAIGDCTDGCGAQRDDDLPRVFLHVADQATSAGSDRREARSDGDRKACNGIRDEHRVRAEAGLTHSVAEQSTGWADERTSLCDFGGAGRFADDDDGTGRWSTRTNGPSKCAVRATSTVIDAVGPWRSHRPCLSCARQTDSCSSGGRAIARTSIRKSRRADAIQLLPRNCAAATSSASSGIRLAPVSRIRPVAQTTFWASVMTSFFCADFGFPRCAQASTTMADLAICRRTRPRSPQPEVRIRKLDTKRVVELVHGLDSVAARSRFRARSRSRTSGSERWTGQP